MNLETIAISFIQNIPLFWIVGFILVALWGDGSFIIFTVVAVNYNVSLWIVFTAAYFGTLFGDMIWFGLGKKFLYKFREGRKFSKQYNRIVGFIERTFGKRSFLGLCIIKFLYGTRIIFTLYLANKNMTYLRFLIYDLIANLIWVTFVGAIGYLVGIGFGFVLRTFKNIELLLTLVVILVLIFNYIQKRISEKLEKQK